MVCLYVRHLHSAARPDLGVFAGWADLILPLLAHPPSAHPQPIASQQELDAFLTEAGDKLVFLSVESTEECDLGDNPDAWTVQRTVSDDPMAPCLQMKDTLQRVARDCNDAIFLTLTVTSGHSKEWELARELGVTRFPTFQVLLPYHTCVWAPTQSCACFVLCSKPLLSRCHTGTPPDSSLLPVFSFV